MILRRIRSSVKRIRRNGSAHKRRGNVCEIRSERMMTRTVRENWKKWLSRSAEGLRKGGLRKKSGEERRRSERGSSSRGLWRCKRRLRSRDR